MSSPVTDDSGSPRPEVTASESVVEYDVAHHIAVITLNRPRRRNAFDEPMAASFARAVDLAETDDDVWVAVIRANVSGQARPVFCAGADLSTVRRGAGDELSTDSGGFAGFVDRERTKPVIAAVDGLATGGGLELVLACDLIVASTRSSFGLAEVRRSLIAGAGGLHRLPRAVGRHVAMDMALTGVPIDAERAHALGLVSRLAPPEDLVNTAMELATQIVHAAPLAVRASRRVVRAASGQDEEQLTAMARDEFRAIASSDDLQEGLAAFSEKRSAVWRAR